MGPVIIEEPEPSRIYIEQQKNPDIMATIVDIENYQYKKDQYITA